MYGFSLGESVFHYATEYTGVNQIENLHDLLTDDSKIREMWGYLAGCVDCDGWISRSNHINKDGELSVNYRFVIGITQHVKCRAGMEYIRDFLESQGVTVTLIDRDSNTHHHTPMLNITVKQIESVIIFLENIIPRMTFKKELAQEALEFTRLKRGKRLLKRDDVLMEKRRYWKPEELVLLAQMKDEGYNNIAIGSALGRSSSSVAQKLQRIA